LLTTVRNDAAQPRRGVLRRIWVIGFVSMFMDISTGMIHSLLPVFIVSVPGGSVFYVGLIEGMGESTAMIVNISRLTFNVER
jgi:hypothetical protein